MWFRIDTSKLGQAVKDAVTEALNNQETRYKKAGDLEKEIAKLKEEKGDLELKKRMEQEEIKHLVKMKEEKQLIEATKKELELRAEYQKKEMALQTQYHEKQIEQIDDARTEMREIYKEIMERLPNVNMEIKRGK